MAAPDFTQAEDRYRLLFAELCALNFELTGDARYARAGGALRGKPAHRGGIDDSQALRLVAIYLESGVAKSRNRAIEMVSQLFAPGRGYEAMIRRLHRKISDTTKADIVSAAPTDILDETPRHADADLREGTSQ